MRRSGRCIRATFWTGRSMTRSPRDVRPFTRELAGLVTSASGRARRPDPDLLERLAAGTDRAARALDPARRPGRDPARRRAWRRSCDPARRRDRRGCRDRQAVLRRRGAGVRQRHPRRRAARPRPSKSYLDSLAARDPRNACYSADPRSAGTVLVNGLSTEITAAIASAAIASLCGSKCAYVFRTVFGSSPSRPATT